MIPIPKHGFDQREGSGSVIAKRNGRLGLKERQGLLVAVDNNRFGLQIGLQGVGT